MSLPAYAMNQTSFPEMYERWLVGPLFRPWAETLIERARLEPGDRVLDIACGTGIVARLARERLGDSGYVVGVDVSPQMIGVARTVAPRVNWRQGNAGQLPIESGERFTVVTCQQGLQFFPDKPQAVREMRRAIAPGGRLLVAVWRSLDDNPFFRDAHRVAERHVGDIVDTRYAFGDPAALRELIADGGFDDVRLETETLTMRFQDPGVFLRMNAQALVGMSAAGQTMSDDERARQVEAIAEDSSEELRGYIKGDELVYELVANVAIAGA